MTKKLRELAELVEGTVVGDGEVEISGIGAIEDAGPGQVTFVAHPKYLAKLKESRASAVIVSREVPGVEKPLLLVANPYLAFAKILGLFSSRPHQPGGISSDACVSATAELGQGVTVYPFVWIGDRCRIGDRVVLHPGVTVGEDSYIGEDSVLYPGVSLYPGTIVGKRAILHSGVVVGSDGFGYVKEGRKNVKIPQVGSVEIEDDVEIGANTTVDRATLGKTLIRRGAKIDNLVQVAHNVIIGEDSLIVAQVGIAGSTRIGSNVTLAGQVGVGDHADVGDNVMIGAQSGVIGNLPGNAIYTGTPAIPHRQFLRVINVYQKLPELNRRLLDLEKRVAAIDGGGSPKEKEE
jgi:UDP-3-O-[3-hydroxymyristoyl] glucosamine N-acyltransferase